MSSSTLGDQTANVEFGYGVKPCTKNVQNFIISTRYMIKYVYMKKHPDDDKPLKCQPFVVHLVCAKPSFGRRQWHPTPVLLPGKSHGWRSLVGCSPWGHDWVTSLSLSTFMHWRRKCQPTPVFLPGESQGRGSLVGCRLWGRTESEMTEAT